MDERHRYFTHAAHGNHAIGDACWVTFTDAGRIARLEFDDGEVVELARGEWRFPGIDPLTLDEQIAHDIDTAVLGFEEGT